MLATLVMLLESCSGSGDDPNPTLAKPTISIDPSGNQEVGAGQSFAIDISASQGSAPITDLDIVTPSERKSISYDDESSITYRFEEIAPINKGSYHYSFTVYDRDGKTASVSKSVTVNDGLVVFDIDESAVPVALKVGEKVTLSGSINTTSKITKVTLSSSTSVAKEMFEDAKGQEKFSIMQDRVVSYTSGTYNLRLEVYVELDPTRPYVWTGKDISVVAQNFTQYDVEMETQLTVEQKSFFDTKFGNVMTKEIANEKSSLVDVVLYEDQGKFYLAGPKSVPTATFDGWDNDRKADLMLASTDQLKEIYENPSTAEINGAFISYEFDGNDPEQPVELNEGDIYLIQAFNENRDGVLKVSSINASEHKVSISFRLID